MRERGDRVIVIEADSRHEGLNTAAPVMFWSGAATDPWFLRQARIGRARLLMVLFDDDDGNNVETVVHAHTLKMNQPRGKLRCVLQVSEPRLRPGPVSRALQPARRPVRAPGVQNVFEVVARVMLREALPGTVYAGRVGRAPGSLAYWSSAWAGSVRHSPAASGEGLAARSSRTRSEAFSDPGRSGTLRAGAQQLGARAPPVCEACVLECHDLDVRGPEFLRGEFLDNRSGMPVTAAFICIGDDTLSALLAVPAARRAPQRANGPDSSAG